MTLGNLVVSHSKRYAIVIDGICIEDVFVVFHLSVVDGLFEAVFKLIAILVNLNNIEVNLLFLFLSKVHVSSEPLGDDQLRIFRSVLNLQNVAHEIDVHAVFTRVVRVVRVIGDDEAIQRRVELHVIRSLGLLKVVNGILLECHTVLVPAE